MSEIDQALVEHLAPRLEKGIEDTIAEVATLSPEQFNTQPSPKSWSPAQILEHLSATVEPYNKNTEEALAKVDPTSEPSPRKKTLFGGMLLWSLNPAKSMKLKAPGTFAPKQATDFEPAQVIDRFETCHRALGKLMQDSSDKPLSRAKLSTPVAGFLRLNAAESFEIAVVHLERHLEQIRRIKPDL